MLKLPAKPKQVLPTKQSQKQISSKPSQLNKNNYYDKDQSWHYLSVSLFKDFKKCEAAALAKLKDEWQPDRSPTALLVGNYLHSYFESAAAHKAFIEANKAEILAKAGKNKGKPKADYQQAEKMIATLANNNRFNELYQGDKEVIVTGELYGVQWKGKIDCLNLKQGYFVDLKTTKDIDGKEWSPIDHRKYGFIKNYGYYYQMAVYQKLIKQTFGVDCVPFIVAVSKQDIPAKRAFSFAGDEDQYELQAAMTEIESYQPRLLQVMNGEIEPKRCGKCEYCRSTSDLELVDASSLND
ncbi:PD-(D/E)XK nuclease-like domain-containing protein [Loigolactobacillus coryniformis]|uniref:PD-(D/E)XK nuclease-like domain-containing protein n=1 Tax=Loigolactobacillus coryniformis TaxID=1610 RepID=UPI003F209C73